MNQNYRFARKICKRIRRRKAERINL